MIINVKTIIIGTDNKVEMRQFVGRVPIVNEVVWINLNEFKYVREVHWGLDGTTTILLADNLISTF